LPEPPIQAPHVILLVQHHVDQSDWWLHCWGICRAVDRRWIATAPYDRGAKFAHYRQIATLQEIALIDPDSRRADVYRRGADGLWVLHPFDPGQGVAFASVQLVIADEALYADID
jgi:hypothetical protein